MMTTTTPMYNYHDLQMTDYHISKTILQMFVLYILSGNKSIRRSHLMNLSTLINSYDICHDRFAIGQGACLVKYYGINAT